MEFRILGSLEAEARGELLKLGGLSEQKLLAVLLLGNGHVVPVTRLVDALWGDNPPTMAVKQVQNAVSRLRRLLAIDGEASPVVTQHGGYRILANGATFDARAFDVTVSKAETAAAAGELAPAAALLKSALGLWRGPALAGLTGRIIEAAAGAWNERRCATQETYLEHRLALGEHQRIVGDLQELVAAHPLRERPVAQLMLALYRCGRQAEALDAYASARAVLASELGLDPGSQLQWLQQRILTRDPEIDAPAVTRPQARLIGAQPGWLAVPRQLPAAPSGFVGRGGEQAELTRMLDGRHEQGGTVFVSAIGGTAGIGKTALALHWAHRVADRFPDGQLYVNLRGFDPSGVPMPPAEAVRGFLTALNVPVARIPASLDEQAALYRSLLADKKVLIVADNARDSAQVRPLLPGSPGCLVVVTSRSQLAGLAADGARPVTLGLLAGREARQFLTGRLGRDRLAAEPWPTGELISLCAGLPLALSIASARAAADDRRPLALLSAELRDARSRLDALDAGDQVSVRAAFSWSYGALPVQTARLFRLLGLHPGPDISAPAAASLADVGRAQARQLLAELARAHLVQEQPPGRYACHDLLRSYAAELAGTKETDGDRLAAQRRLLDHYLHTARPAALLLHPAREAIDIVAASAGTEPEHLSDQAEALSWFAAEQRVLLSAVTLAADAGFPGHAWQLAWTLANFLDRRGYWHDWRSMQQTGLRAARESGDLRGQAHAHSLLGRVEVSLRRYDKAQKHFTRALDLFRLLSDQAACARAYLDLGWTADQRGCPAEATRPMRRALEIYRSISHEVGEAHTLSNLGWHYARRGDHGLGIACCREALVLHRAHGNVVVRAATLDTLGYIHHLLGEYSKAIGYYRRAVAELGQLGSQLKLANTLSRLGDSQVSSGSTNAARETWQRSLAVLEQLGHPAAADVRDKLDSLCDSQRVPEGALARS